ncbi:MAG: P-loop domain protein [Flavipsychrobacter sp.]|jgi:hypothetical protein|nr:P-loop domain protein [Flavipsychrobacter sp.]
MSTQKCYITDVEVEDFARTPNYEQYSITYNNYGYTLKIAIVGWGQAPHKLRNNWVLRGMLFNNEWDIDANAILTANLLSQVTRLGKYPKNFGDKINYFVLKYYRNGGGEYKTFKLDFENYQSAYAETRDEYVRIVDGLTSKGLIKILDEFSSFKLTEKGISLAENLDKDEKSIEPVRIISPETPRVYTFSLDIDSYYAAELGKLLLFYGFSLSNFDKINEDDLGSSIYGSKTGIYRECDYTIFLKSAPSDSDNTFGSILDIAIEAHTSTEKQKHNFVYIALVDDSGIASRPRLNQYHKCLFDFRIISNRPKLIKAIQNDWNNRGDKEGKYPVYNLPTINVNDNERKWLEIIYKKFNDNEEYEAEKLFATMWDEFPNDFTLQNINPLLTYSGRITLYGIWHVDSNSRWLTFFDKVIFAIRNIITQTGEINSISTKLLQRLLPDISAPELAKVFELISQTGKLSNGMSSGPNEASLTIRGEQIYLRYRNYTGLQDFIVEYLNQWQNKGNVTDNTQNKDSEKELLNKKINLEDVHSYKTQITYPNKQLNPVMGVCQLSRDLAEIIHDLPNEKGQMIGIFGKWGRGKTFFINELWNNLKKKEDIAYTHIEYHAWKYQDTPASWAYLYEIFAEKYLGNKKTLKNLIAYYRKLIFLNYKRTGLTPFVSVGLLLLSAIVSSLIIYMQKESKILLPAVPILLAFGIKAILKLKEQLSTKAKDIIKTYGTYVSFKEKMGIQADIQTELVNLICTWIPEKKLGKEKIILIVEDIDRCSEEKILQNIDALRIMLENEDICRRVIIITAIDERVLKNAIKIKYSSLQKSLDKKDNEKEKYLHGLISEYLDKLFISAIKLGDLSTSQKEEFLNELLRNDILQETFDELEAIERKERIKENFKNAIPETIIENMMHEESFVDRWKAYFEQENPLEQTGEVFDLALEHFGNIDDDLAIQDSKGNVTSGARIQASLNKRVVNQNKIEKLSHFELKYLRKTIGLFENATPRSIRIFYYRYLLSKNLLSNFYTSINRLNIWQHEKGIEILMKLLLKYTLLCDSIEISRAKAEVYKDGNENKIEVEGELVFKKDYFFLLEIFELVVAY